jgi:transcriptional regulator with XRE-family HTH domain
MTLQTAASFDAEAPLGERLRLRRKALKLTLQEVADNAGLSVGFISQVERGLTAPSLSSLTNIAQVLQARVTDFLQQPDGPTDATRSGARQVYALGAETPSYERLSSAFPGHQISAVVMHEKPGHRSEPIAHQGEELFYIIDGELTVELDRNPHILKKGDSLHFASTRTHSTWNHTPNFTSVLHVCTMDVFGDESTLTDAPGMHAGHD